MSYLVLARKSRPQVFAEVVGQQVVVRTLQNALQQRRVPHALIFSGVRGTGKTTLARIMAKALNCEMGPTSEPCGSCQSCLDIKAGNAVDLHEIDGATNTGVDDIRKLKENISFMPISARYKIIIIDEVHMLSTSAFNALLKTLEEPPEHVYFMFATTELHKVPLTILSRCQRYELKHVAHNELFEHFASLAKKEGVAIEETALHQIVREAGGSVRDGLSLLDQVFSYCGETVTDVEVTEVLGLVSHQMIANLSEALLDGDLAAALAGLDELYSYGMDLKRFINELLTWFRGLVICSVSKQPEKLLDLPVDELVVLQKIAAAHSAESLSLMFNLLMEGLEKATFSARPRFGVEMAFIKAVQAKDVVPVTTLLTRLDDALVGVSLPQATARPAQPPVEVKESSKPEESAHSAPVAKGSQVSEPKAKPPLPPEPESLLPDTDPLAEKIPLPPESVEPVQDNNLQGKTAEPKNLGSKKDVRKDWPEFIKYVRDRVKWMAGILQRASSAQLENGVLSIVYDDAVDCGIFKNKEKLIPLTEFAMDFFQESLQIKFTVPNATGCETDPDSGAALQKERSSLANDSLVVTACEVFNGQVGDIRVGPRFRKPLTAE